MHVLGTNRPDQPEVVSSDDTVDLPPPPAEPFGATEPVAFERTVVAPAPPSRGPSRVLSALLGGALVAGGFGIGVLVDNEPIPVVTGPEVTTVTEPGTTPILPSGEEPVAAVADALLP